MYQLSVECHFSAAHHIPNYRGKCVNVHGHRWLVRAGFDVKDVDPLGLTIDFIILKGLLGSLCDELDHTDLNIRFERPTAELIAKWFFDKIADVNGDRQVPCLVWVEVEESPGCFVRYTNV